MAVELYTTLDMQANYRTGLQFVHTRTTRRTVEQATAGYIIRCCLTHRLPADVLSINIA